MSLSKFGSTIADEDITPLSSLSLMELLLLFLKLKRLRFEEDWPGRLPSYINDNSMLSKL